MLEDRLGGHALNHETCLATHTRLCSSLAPQNTVSEYYLYSSQGRGFCLKDIATVLALLGEHFPSLTSNPLIFLCKSLGYYNVALETVMLSFFSYLKSRALHTQERLDAGKQL